MAPGCLSNIQIQNSADTIDSFEILEQTVIKQKRLAKKKKCDLRLRILLKRTFDLVCEIMDRENGFNDDYIDNSSNTSSNINNDNYSNCSIEQQKQQQQQVESSTTITITTIERPIESIPLPPDNDYESCCSVEDSNSIQLVPDEKIDNVIIEDHKEYHMLTNVQTDFFNHSNNEKSFKRKFDDNYDKSNNSTSNNKKLKLVDIFGSAKVNKNEVQFVLCY